MNYALVINLNKILLLENIVVVNIVNKAFDSLEHFKELVFVLTQFFRVVQKQLSNFLTDLYFRTILPDHVFEEHFETDVLVHYVKAFVFLNFFKSLQKFFDLRVFLIIEFNLEVFQDGFIF